MHVWRRESQKSFDLQPPTGSMSLLSPIANSSQAVDSNTPASLRPSPGHPSSLVPSPDPRSADLKPLGSDKYATFPSKRNVAVTSSAPPGGNVSSIPKMNKSVPLKPLDGHVSLPRAATVMDDVVYVKAKLPSRFPGGKPKQQSAITSSAFGMSATKAGAPHQLQQSSNNIGAALVKTLDVDSNLPIADQRQQVTDWVEGFSRELQLHDSTSVTIEVMLNQVMEGTKELGSPNPLRLAVVCLLAERLQGIMGRYGHMFSTLLQELFASCYMPVENRPQDEFVAERLASMGIQPSSGIQKYLSRRAYFEAYGEVADRESSLATQVEHLSECIARQEKVLDISCSAWQLLLKRAVFFAWRGHSRQERTRIDRLNRFVARFSHRDVMQTHFYAWRVLVYRWGAERSRKQYTEAYSELASKEAAANVRMLDAEDALEETKLVSTRLKEEKLNHELRSKQLISASESAVYKATAWRNVTTDAVNFLGNIRQTMSNVCDVGGSDFGTCGELAVGVILAWVRTVIKDVPKSDKVRCNNFGSDLRDGRVFVMLLHVITNGDVELQNLAHRDHRKRMAIVIDALHNLKLHLPITADDLVGGVSEYNFLVLFNIWWHYALPPTPEGDVCINAHGGFRDDLDATKAYLDQCRQFYPRWLEHRATLQQYAIYILCCRTQGKSAKVLSAEEGRQLRRDLHLFAVRQVHRIPSVFLTGPATSFDQRQQNEDERKSVNDTIGRHIELLRSTFEYYASQDLGQEGKSKKRKPKTAAQEAQMVYGVMEFTGFYRFCEDLHLICAVEQTSKIAPASKPSGNDVRKSKKGESEPEEPEQWMMTKSQCFQLFKETCARSMDGNEGKVALRTVSSGALTTTAKKEFFPGDWICALMHIAIHRHGAPLLPSSELPAPGSMALESLINKDVAPFACVPAQSPFKTEVWSAPVQAVLQPKRLKLLMPLFEVFAGEDGDGTMSYSEFVRFCEEVVFAKFKPIPGTTLLQIFTQFQSGLDTAGAAEAAVAAATNTSPAASLAASPRAGSGTFSPRSSRSPRQSMVMSPAGGVVPLPPAIQSEMSGSLLPMAKSSDLSPSGRRRTSSARDGTDMVYGEFELAVICVCVFLTPAPYIPLETRLKPFLAAIGEVAAPIVKREEKRRAALLAKQRREAEAEAKREALELQKAEEEKRAEEERQRQASVMQAQMEAMMASSGRAAATGGEKRTSNAQ